MGFLCRLQRIKYSHCLTCTPIALKRRHLWKHTEAQQCSTQQTSRQDFDEQLERQETETAAVFTAATLTVFCDAHERSLNISFITKTVRTPTCSHAERHLCGLVSIAFQHPCSVRLTHHLHIRFNSTSTNPTQSSLQPSQHWHAYMIYTVIIYNGIIKYIII